MNYCSKCGQKLNKGDNFCSNCGANLKTKKEKKEVIKEEKEVLTAEEDINKNKGIAVLSYINILVLIPYFFVNDSEFVRYHSKQGMNFLIVWLIYAIMYNSLTLIHIPNYNNRWYATYETPWFILAILYVIGIALILISIIGIINVCNGRKEELPLIGKIKIIK